MRPVIPDDDGRSERDRLARSYRSFAEATSAQSPCFTAWSLAVADDPEVLAWIARLPVPKRQPNLVYAAARWHGVPAPGPYTALRDALLGDDGAIVATIMERATQTNEAGRLAAVLPAFTRIARAETESLSLLEVGASGGLCLYPDRYDYDWSPAGRLVTGEGRPLLRCPTTGPAPLPTAPLPVAGRYGLDLNPLDVTDPEAAAWLMILVWPEQDERRQRLRTAIELASTDPPVITTGDVRTDVAAQVELAARSGPVLVFHTAVVAYLAREDRVAFHATMTELVAAEACHWVSNEGHGVLPDLTATAPEPPPDQAFTLAVDGVAVGWAHQHGAGLHWFG